MYQSFFFMCKDFVYSGNDACFFHFISIFFHSYKLSFIDADSSQRDTPFPEIGDIKKFKSMFHPTKRARNVENHEFDFRGMFLLYVIFGYQSVRPSIEFKYSRREKKD